MAQDMKRRTKSVRKRRFPSADFVQKKNVFVQISEKSPDILLYGRARREILFSSFRTPLHSTGTRHLRCFTRQEPAASDAPHNRLRRPASPHEYTNLRIDKPMKKSLSRLSGTSAALRAPSPQKRNIHNKR